MSMYLLLPIIVLGAISSVQSYAALSLK